MIHNYYRIPFPYDDQNRKEENIVSNETGRGDERVNFKRGIQSGACQSISTINITV